MKEQQRQQIALVTGSASGIGFETALMLARNGIYTFATMRNLRAYPKIRYDYSSMLLLLKYGLYPEEE